MCDIFSAKFLNCIIFELHEFKETRSFHETNSQNEWKYLISEILQVISAFYVRP